MLDFLSRIHWDEFLKSKAVWSAIGAIISGAIAQTGHQIDPQQLDQTTSALQQLGLIGVELFSTLALVFRTTAKTALMAPPALIPVLGGEQIAIPATKAEAKATLQGLTAGTVVTPAQEAAATQIVPQPLSAKP